MQRTHIAAHSRQGCTPRQIRPIEEPEGRIQPCLQMSILRSFLGFNGNVVFCREPTCNHKIWGYLFLLPQPVESKTIRENPIFDSNQPFSVGRIPLSGSDSSQTKTPNPRVNPRIPHIAHARRPRFHLIPACLRLRPIKTSPTMCRWGGSRARTT